MVDIHETLLAEYRENLALRCGALPPPHGGNFRDGPLRTLFRVLCQNLGTTKHRMTCPQESSPIASGVSPVNTIRLE